MTDFPKMPEAIYRKVSRFIGEECGIQLPARKKTMVEARIRKRMKVLGISDYTDYYRYVFGEEGKRQELVHMIDVVTTNKTHFFREAAHFDFLERYSGYQPGILNLLSAGCSSGEEPYTLAIVLTGLMKKGSFTDFQITGTDLSTRVLQTAVQGIYPEKAIEGVPLSIKRQYFMKSKDRTHQTVKIAAALRKKVQFQRLNLMDASYGFASSFNIIFCRNVLIYFDKPTQAAVIGKLAAKLKMGGLLFLGHSESTAGMDLKLRQLQPTIYQKI